LLWHDYDNIPILIDDITAEDMLSRLFLQPFLYPYYIKYNLYKDDLIDDFELFSGLSGLIALRM